eukprot:2633381-Pleurochrysis_carterae.AAC.3
MSTCVAGRQRHGRGSTGVTCQVSFGCAHRRDVAAHLQDTAHLVGGVGLLVTRQVDGLRERAERRKWARTRACEHEVAHRHI